MRHAPCPLYHAPCHRFHGGWLNVQPGESLQKIFDTQEWNISAMEGEQTVTLTLTFKVGNGRPAADIIARMQCDLPHTSARKPYGDSIYYQLCRTPAAGTVDEIARHLPNAVMQHWLHPGPAERLRDGATGDGDPVERRAAWLWTSPYCYTEVNRGVIGDDATRLKLYAPLMRSINFYIEANSPAQACVVWRGSKMDRTTYDAFEEGCHYRFCMYSAYSQNRAVAEAFHNTALIKLNVPERCRTAAWFEPVTYYEGEQELLLAPYTVGACVQKWKEDVLGHADVPFIEFTIAQDSDEFQIRPGAEGMQTEGAFDEGVVFRKPYKGDFCR